MACRLWADVQPFTQPVLAPEDFCFLLDGFNLTNSFRLNDTELKQCLVCLPQPIQSSLYGHCRNGSLPFECWNRDPHPLHQNATIKCSWSNITNHVGRFCSVDGSWACMNPGTFMSSCYRDDFILFLSFVKYFTVVGHILSIVAILIAIAIFRIYRSTLSCSRIKIHLHLFITFAATDFLWCVWELVLNEPFLIRSHPDLCKAYRMVTWYATVANHLWMFCEGLYLYLVIGVVFIYDHYVLNWCYAIGWGLSFVLVFIWTVARTFSSLDSSEQERCWVTDSPYDWVYQVPVLATILMSFVILVKVLYLIWLRIHNTPYSHVKITKGALILIPLLGVQYLLLLYKPDNIRNDLLHKIFFIIEALLTSFQGLTVSILFCFTNNDVQATLSHARQRRDLSRPTSTIKLPFSFTTQLSTRAIRTNITTERPIS